MRDDDDRYEQDPDELDDDADRRRRTPAAEHAANTDDDDAANIAVDWADAYPEGTELFCADFGPEDFETGDYAADSDYTVDGGTVAVKRCIKKPPPGWLRKHSHLTDMDRTFALLQIHACDEALEVLDALTGDAWGEFVENWGRDGGLLPGKSKRSLRRSKRTKLR